VRKKASKYQTIGLAEAHGWRLHLKAVAVLFFIVLNLSFWLCPLLVLVFFKWVLRLSRIRRIINMLMTSVYQIAVQCNSWLLFSFLGIQLDVEGIEEAYSEKFYLVIANHQSWSDILILQHLLNFRAPVLKFLVKRELIYLPLVGLICWAYDYPFLHRHKSHSGNDTSEGDKKDVDILNSAMLRFLRSTSTIVNFVEGTRYSKAKARGQESPYEYLLKPKAGGLALICNMIGSRLAAIIDVTIVYDAHRPTFWRFIGGGIRRVKVYVRTISMQEIFKEENVPGRLADRSMMAEWLNGHWTRKDRQIFRMVSDLR
jgi:1-acyl-sn-glycerol-3-phosphate acyltransferase